MDQEQTPLERIRERIKERSDASRLADTRIDAMVRDVRDVRINVSGLSKIVNSSAGMINEFEKIVEAIAARVEALEQLLVTQDSQIAELKSFNATLMKRVDDMARWAASKGKDAMNG